MLLLGFAGVGFMAHRWKNKMAGCTIDRFSRCGPSLGFGKWPHAAASTYDQAALRKRRDSILPLG
jgi:hypothetical protein